MSAFLLLSLYSLSFSLLDHSGKFKLLCLVMQLRPHCKQCRVFWLKHAVSVTVSDQI